MSEYTKTAIYSALSGDAALSALLATDEGGEPAVFAASLNKYPDAPFPCITVREAEVEADPRFEAAPVDAETFEIEVWARTESALTVPRIHAEVERVMGNLLVEGETLYYCGRTGETPDLYDDKLDLLHGMAKYRLIVGR
ncbi:MAG: tail completion protein gp17 [Armatimonadota bacterium]